MQRLHTLLVAGWISGALALAPGEAAAFPASLIADERSTLVSSVSCLQDPVSGAFQCVEEDDFQTPSPVFAPWATDLQTSTASPTLFEAEGFGPGTLVNDPGFTQQSSSLNRYEIRFQMDATADVHLDLTVGGFDPAHTARVVLLGPGDLPVFPEASQDGEGSLSIVHEGELAPGVYAIVAEAAASPNNSPFPAFYQVELTLAQPVPLLGSGARLVLGLGLAAAALSGFRLRRTVQGPG